MSQFRTHTCGELRKSDVGKTVKVAGWIHSVRDHGGVIFIDLRDHYGLTQVVIDPEKDFYQALDRWRVETVIAFTGKVNCAVNALTGVNISTTIIDDKGNLTVSAGASSGTVMNRNWSSRVAPSMAAAS